MFSRAVGRSKSEGANFYCRLWKVDVKSQVDVNSTHGGLGACILEALNYFKHFLLFNEAAMYSF